MLWIEKYRPRTFEEIIGQEKVVERLTHFATSHAVPHLMLAGPPGTGKSASVECLARILYQDHAEENLTIIPTSDLFSLGRKFLEDEERYAHLYRADESVLTNFKRIIREYSSLRPLDAEFKLIAFEGASSLPREAQQALRRIMERSSRTCRFIYCTSHPSAIIPAIASRCLPVFFSPLPDHLVESHLRTICARECAGECPVPEDQIGLLVAAAHGDLRKAVMLLQVAAESGSGANLLSLSRTETGHVATAAFSALQSGDVQAASRRIETLMIEYGLSAREVLKEIAEVTRREFNDPRITCALADTDSLLGHSQNEYLQLNALVVRIGREVSHVGRPG
jgi:replication factor C small subunit